MQRLLDDVVTPESGCGHLGPNRSAILEMVGRERARRKRRKTILGVVAGAAGCALLAALLMWQAPARQQPTLAAPAVVDTAPAPPPIMIHEVDDKELLELLKGTPIALMEWPDGSRTLLVVQR